MAAVGFDHFIQFLDRVGVSQKKAFGKPALFVNGNMFLYVEPSGVAFKLNEDGFAGTPAEGKTLPTPANAPRPMNGWRGVPFEVDADWLALAEQALVAVAAKLPPK